LRLRDTILFDPCSRFSYLLMHAYYQR